MRHAHAMAHGVVVLMRQSACLCSTECVCVCFCVGVCVGGCGCVQGFASVNLIGKGGFGEVFRGVLDGVPVAVKVMDVGPEAMQVRDTHTHTHTCCHGRSIECQYVRRSVPAHIWRHMWT